MTHPATVIADLLSLPNLKITKCYRNYTKRFCQIEATSQSQDAVCMSCGQFTSCTYDHRISKAKDSPVRDFRVTLIIKKKRFYCRPCKKTFTELIPGIFSRARVTDRLRKHILYTGNQNKSLKNVAHNVGLSLTSVQRHFYAALQVNQARHLNYTWPKDLGIDENRYGKAKNGRGSIFNTIFTDHTHDRVYDVQHTRNSKILFENLKHTLGRENVLNVTIDLSEGFRSLVRALFPNAKITADRFHVERLLIPAINKRRKQLAGDRRTNPIGNLLLRSGHNLQFVERIVVERWLQNEKELKTIYQFKERIKTFYRIRGYERAKTAMDYIIADLKNYTHIRELKTLHWTLSRWKNEITNFFRTGLTNARAEGFNHKISILKSNAYGYKNPNHLKLRILSDCF